MWHAVGAALGAVLAATLGAAEARAAGCGKVENPTVEVLVIGGDPDLDTSMSAEELRRLSAERGRVPSPESKVLFLYDAEPGFEASTTARLSLQEDGSACAAAQRVKVHFGWATQRLYIARELEGDACLRQAATAQARTAAAVEDELLEQLAAALEPRLERVVQRIEPTTAATPREAALLLHERVQELTHPAFGMLQTELARRRSAAATMAELARACDGRLAEWMRSETAGSTLPQ